MATAPGSGPKPAGMPSASIDGMSPFQKGVVATDFSETAEDALNAGSHLVREEVMTFEETRKSARQFAPSRDSLVGAIQEEFSEMPCMRLTRAQFRRLWNLTAADSDQLVRGLIASGFLSEDPEGRIGRPVETY